MTDLSTGSVFAGYRIEGAAGHGGMGVVYRVSEMRGLREGIGAVADDMVSPQGDEVESHWLFQAGANR